MHNILEKVCKTINKNNLIDSGDSILVALSGGADSVCLLKVLNELKDKYNIKLYAAHLNHMLRGDDADADEKFAKDLCESFSIPFFSKKEDVLKYAKDNMQTTEEAGRNLRYQFFEEISEKFAIDKIATAHNQNDNVETVLMRFIRGTGIFGLSGIPYKNKNIIRPVLDLSRKEIEEFLSSKSGSFVTDQSNCEPIYFRNKVRLLLIPEIEKSYNPHFKETLSSNIENFKNATDYLKTVTGEKIKKLVHFKKNYAYLRLVDFAKEHEYIKTSIIYCVLEEYGRGKQITSERIRDIIKIAENRKGSVDFSKNLYATAMYDNLFFILKKEHCDFCYTSEIPGRVYIKECDVTLSFEVTDTIKKSKNSLYADYKEIEGKTITIRNRKDGDFFYPTGMTGKKKLKDFFIDKKIPAFLRNEIPICLANDEIFCIGNLRISDKYKTKSDTLKFLKIELFDGGITNDTKRR